MLAIYVARMLVRGVIVMVGDGTPDEFVRL